MQTATYRRPLGSVAVTALNDGQFAPGGFGLVTGIDAAMAEHQERAAFRRTPPWLTVNAFLVEHADGTRTLIDAGAAGSMGPTLGRVRPALAAIGVDPASIGTVLLTHLHPDHISGLVDDQGAASLPAAELVLSGAEHAFWHDDAIMAGAGEGGRPYFEGARRAVAPYLPRMRHVADGATAAPGITAVALPGHTPGHTGYRIESGGETLLIWGDIIHLPGIQFALPHAGVAFDVDGDAARATRARILDAAATDRHLIAGMHLDFPTFGYVARAAEGYAFVPDAWRAA